MKVREDFTEAVTFEQGPPGGERGSQIGLQEKEFHAEGTARTKASVYCQL